MDEARARARAALLGRLARGQPEDAGRLFRYKIEFESTWETFLQVKDHLRGFPVRDVRTWQDEVGGPRAGPGAGGCR